MNKSWKNVEPSSQQDVNKSWTSRKQKSWMSCEQDMNKPIELQLPTIQVNKNDKIFPLYYLL